MLVCGTLTVTAWRVEVPLLAAMEEKSAAEVQVEAVTVSGGVAELPLTVTAKARSVDWWLVIWLSGAAVCLSPLTASVWRVRKMLARTRRVADDDPLGEMAAALNGGRRMTLMFSDAVVVPLTVGMFSPKIVLPSSASAWSAERLRRVLAHELAHQQRHDLAWALLARVVCAWCWFNPLAWFAAHRQRLESERACDDCVINSGAAAVDYADDLLQILRDCPRDVLSPLVMTMARHSQIKSRLQSLLAADVQRNAVSRFAAFALTVSVLLLAATLTITRITHAAGDADGDKAIVPSPSAAEVENKLVEISAKFIAVQKDAAILKTAEFKKAWADADREKIIRLLEVEAGADLMSEPMITLSFGQKAKIRAMRELRYPADWDADETEKTEPKNFQTANVGGVVDIFANWKDGKILLDAKLRQTEFEGFINYGTSGSDARLTPVFKENTKPLTVSVRDGGSVAGWFPGTAMVVSEQAVSDLPSGAEVIGSQPRIVKQQTVNNQLLALVLTVRLVDKPLTVSMAEKLEKIIIPKVEFADSDIGEVLNYLQEQSKAQDPLRVGVNMVFKAAGADQESQRSLTLDLREVRLKKILDFITQLTSYQYKVEENCVYIFPKTEPADPLLVRTFTVPENFFPLRLFPRCWPAIMPM